MTYSSIHMYIYICIKLVSYLRKSFLVDWVCVPEEAFVGEPPKKVKVLSLAKLITVCMGLKFRNLSPHTGINWQDHCNIMLYIYIYILACSQDLGGLPQPNTFRDRPQKAEGQG